MPASYRAIEDCTDTAALKARSGFQLAGVLLARAGL